MRTINTIQSAFVAGLLVAGCAPSGDLVGPTKVAAPLAGQPVTLYEFVEHGPAVELERSISARPSDLECAARCVVDFSPARLACASADAAGCHAAANAGVAACIESTCYERHDAFQAPACTQKCATEAVAVQSDCASPDCMFEANDVYSVCYDAECRDGHVAGRLVERLVDTEGLQDIREDVAEPMASEGGMGFDCEAACQAYEVNDYLGCVANNPADATACRERSGGAYTTCMTTHCPAS